MARYLNGLPRMVEIWADESETLWTEGASMSQRRRIAKIIAPMEMMEMYFLLTSPKRSLGMANRRRHKGAYAILLIERNRQMINIRA